MDIPPIVQVHAKRVRTVQIPDVPALVTHGKRGKNGSGLTYKQTELACNLLFDCTVRLGMADHEQVQHVNVHHISSMRRVQNWVERVFQVAFGRMLTLSELSDDGMMFGFYLTEQDMQNIYQYCIEFRQIRAEDGMTSSWMSPWTVFRMEEGHRMISVMSPNQVAFLDICHQFPKLAAGLPSDSDVVPNMICSMGPALAAKAFGIMNICYEDQDDGTVKWGTWMPR